MSSSLANRPRSVATASRAGSEVGVAYKDVLTLNIVVFCLLSGVFGIRRHAESV